MTITSTDCDCHMWDKIGADVGNIPDCHFGGILYYTNKLQAAKKWIELDGKGPLLMAKYRARTGGILGPPFYWAVHLNGQHILNIQP